MAPKASDAAETAELVELFKKIGLTQSKAAEAAKSAKSATALRAIVDAHALATREPPLEEKQAVLLAALAVQSAGKLADGERDYAVGAVLDGRLKTTDQVAGEWLSKVCWNVMVLRVERRIEATKYLEGHPVPVEDVAFDAACGVGM